MDAALIATFDPFESTIGKRVPSIASATSSANRPKEEPVHGRVRLNFSCSRSKNKKIDIAREHRGKLAARIGCVGFCAFLDREDARMGCLYHRLGVVPYDLFCAPFLFWLAIPSTRLDRGVLIGRSIRMDDMAEDRTFLQKQSISNEASATSHN